MGVLNVCVEAGVKSKKIIITTIISLVSALSIQSQIVQAAPDKAPDAKEEKLQDYSKGFQVFYKLGLPDVSKAEYISFNCQELQPLHSLMSNRFRTKGNAWLLQKEEGDSPASFIVFNAVPLKAYNGEKLLEEFKKQHKGAKVDSRKEYFEFLAGHKNKTIAFWRNADIKEDCEMLLAQLEEMDKENFSYQKEMSGSLFLYAIQIYSKGFKNEANKIIARLFELADDKKIVLLSAMNTLADQEYGVAILDLEKSRDWKKFEAALDALLKKYPKGWNAAPGIKLLSEMVKKQSAQPIPPEIKREGISENDKKLASELLNIKEMPYFCGMEWLFRKNEKEESSRIQDDTLKKITKNSIPMLIALLKDEYMVPVCERSYEHQIDEENGGGNAEKALAAIPSPIKRKSIAKNLLAPVVVISEMNEDSNVMGMNDEDFAAMCNKWYEEIKNKTEDELALYYLKNGNSDQKHFAMTYMKDKDIDKNAPVIEEYFLNIKKEELISNLRYGSIPEYVSKRKKAAKPFVEKLKAIFKGELAAAAKEKKKDKAVKKEVAAEDAEAAEEEEDESAEENAEMLKELKKSFETLDELTSGKSAKDIIDEIVSGKKNIKDDGVYTQLGSALSEMDKDEGIGALFYGISKIKDDPALRNNFILLLVMVKDVKSESESSQESGGAKSETFKEEKPFCIEKNAEGWKKLLADKTKYKDYEIRQLAAWFIEYIYGTDENAKKVESLGHLIGERISSIALKRAEERLAGKVEKDLTPYPEIKDLDDVVGKKLAEDLAKAIADKKAVEFINSLNNNDFAFLAKLVEKNPKLNPGLKNHANRVVFVESSVKGEEKELDAFKNTVLDLKAVEKIRDYCKKLTAEKKMFNCSISRSAMFDGISIEISDPYENVEVPIERPSDSLSMSGDIRANKCAEHTRWEIAGKSEKGNGDEIVVDGKKIKLESSEKSEMENKREKKSQEKFAKCLENIFGDEADCTKFFSINYSCANY